jgi:serine/threonine-protein kinase
MADILHRLQAALGDRYRIERELGRGGMGLVYLAEDLKLGRKVALKVLRPELAQSIGTERFLREIRIAAQLNHPNVLALIDSGEAAGFFYYVMFYVEGESLRDRLNRERQLALEDALTITREVADALSYAHSLGIIHRDIKPENILFEAGHAVVGDFGIARAISEAGGDKLTESGLAIGTPAYMSPEQATGADRIDARSDIYSLGCVLYEMLVGDPPYMASTPQAILARKALEPVPSLRVVRDTIPVSVEAAIRRALSRVPADRFATVQGFVGALSDERAAFETPAPWVVAPRGARWLGPAAAIGLVVVIGSIGWVARRRAEGPTTIGAAFTQLTTEPGIELFPSLSPDGRWLVYAGVSSGNRDIYLRSVGGENSINLTAGAPEDDDQPAFSPDGERIAFRSERDGGGIFVMGRTGEAVKRVTRGGFKPTWSPDGARLAYVTENVELNPQNSEGQSHLLIVDLSSGESQDLNVGDAVLPSWSPNGHRIAFTQRLVGPAGGELLTVPATGGDATVVVSDTARDWNPVWSPDGRFLYFASDRGGSMNLWRVRLDERSGTALGAPEPVTTPATSLAHISVSTDGRHIAYSSVLVTSNIQRIGFDPVRLSVVGEPAWVTTGSRRWSSPDPAPDGEWVVFYSLTNPEGDIYVARTDGTGLRQVVRDTAVDRVPRWSPDGEWIAVFSNRSGPLQIWKIRPDGSDLRQLTNARNTAVPVWSPDGRRMAASGGLAGLNTVYVFDPGRPWEEQAPVMLTPSDSAFARFRPDSWSPDGERLVGDFRYGDAGVATYTFRTRAYERLTDLGQWPVWLPDSRHVLFVSGGNAFYVVDRITKRTRKVFEVQRDVIGPPRLTRDGRMAVYSRRVTEADVWMVTLR